MKCSEFKEQLGAYALGSLSRVESARLEQHLAEESEHEGCSEELERARVTVAKLAYALAPVTPGEHVWARIVRRLTAVAAAPSRPANWREPLAWAVAAAAIVALAVVNDQRGKTAERAHRAEERLTLAASGLADRDRCLRELDQMKSGTALQRDAVALLDRPGSRVVTLKGLAGRGYQASAVINLADQRAIVVSASAPDIADKDLELWVIRGKDPPVPAGFLRRAEGGTALGEIDREVLKAGAPDALAISLEPRGGRPTPTEVVMAGALGG